MSASLLNYELLPYEPAAPAEGKPTTAAFLESAPPAIREAGRRLVDAVGAGRVVFGVKARGGRPYWEFYLYSHAGPAAALAPVRRALAGRVRMPETDPPLPGAPFCWSFELSSGSPAETRTLHFYVGTERNRRRFGTSYDWDGAKLAKQNEYAFYALPEDREPLARALQRAIVGPCGAPFERLLPRELLTSTMACLARKVRGGALPERPNGLYASGLRLPAFRAFLARTAMAEELAARLEREAGSFDHLRFDVGLDFDAKPGALDVVKSAFYGVL